MKTFLNNMFLLGLLVLPVASLALRHSPQMMRSTAVIHAP